MEFFHHLFRIVAIIYLHHTGEKRILEHRKSQHIAYDQDDPLQALKALGLNLGKAVEQMSSFIILNLHCITFKNNNII